MFFCWLLFFVVPGSTISEKSAQQHVTVPHLRRPCLVAVHIWEYVLANKDFLFTLVSITNKQSTRDQMVVAVIRQLVLHCLQHNTSLG